MQLYLLIQEHLLCLNAGNGLITFFFFLLLVILNQFVGC